MKKAEWEKIQHMKATNGSHSKYVKENGQGTIYQRGGEGHIKWPRNLEKGALASLSGVVAAFCNAEPYFHSLYRYIFEKRSRASGLFICTVILRLTRNWRLFKFNLK